MFAIVSRLLSYTGLLSNRGHGSGHAYAKALRTVKVRVMRSLNSFNRLWVILIRIDRAVWERHGVDSGSEIALEWQFALKKDTRVYGHLISSKEVSLAV